MPRSLVANVKAATRPKPALIGTVTPDRMPNVLASSKNKRCSRLPEGTGRAFPTEETALGSGANDDGIELLITKTKVAAGPAFRVR